ncbi:hypothetical protein DPMN_003993 [Dreissena polymorpha]|uniref:Uncharacterized protein n=1 Tax=Dreissena polymorpha TaxID=45954 RepID=A0A9D4RSK9_DREPO|nr:hypothetical protein DPMN_003993 [Dreissena polymorpha]
MEDEDCNHSSQCHSWSKKEIDILLELVIENKNLLEGKYGLLVTEANKRDLQKSATVQDSLLDRRSISRRLTDSLRRCQDRLGTCTSLPYSLRRCQTVSQTGGAPAGNSYTVCDGAKTVYQTGEAPGRDS